MQKEKEELVMEMERQRLEKIAAEEKASILLAEQLLVQPKGIQTRAGRKNPLRYERPKTQQLEQHGRLKAKSTSHGFLTMRVSN